MFTMLKSRRFLTKNLCFCENKPRCWMIPASMVTFPCFMVQNPHFPWSKSQSLNAWLKTSWLKSRLRWLQISLWKPSNWGWIMWNSQKESHRWSPPVAWLPAAGSGPRNAHLTRTPPGETWKVLEGVKWYCGWLQNPH